VYLLPWKMLFLAAGGIREPLRVDLAAVRAARWKVGERLQSAASDASSGVSVRRDICFRLERIAAQPADALDVTYTLQGAAKPSVASGVKPSRSSAARHGSDFSAKVQSEEQRAGRSDNKAERPILVGDSVANRGVPKDDCVGPGPAAVLQPGETLRRSAPRLLSPSMKVFVAVLAAKRLQMGRSPPLTTSPSR